MEIIEQPVIMQQRALGLRAEGLRIGLVPTMGFLHEGHLSLIDLARKHVDVVVVSLFVNPTQFNDEKDFKGYPIDRERDAKNCRDRGVDILFRPDASSMYPDDTSVFIDETTLTENLCGATRPGHFKGVLTVVAKLFNLSLPSHAVFGEKDGQQLRLIQRMVRDLDFPVSIIAGPTIREADGLAKSSRNTRLTSTEREQANCLRAALDLAEQMVESGEREVSLIKQAMLDHIAATSDAEVDYCDFVDNRTLALASEIREPVMVALAVFLGNTRLIDNTVLRPASW
jgi:pantoate--beta-alanine ligase